MSVLELKKCRDFRIVNIESDQEITLSLLEILDPRLFKYKDKPIYLICNEALVVLTEYNLKGSCTTKYLKK